MSVSVSPLPWFEARNKSSSSQSALRLTQWWLTHVLEQTTIECMLNCELGCVSQMYLHYGNKQANLRVGCNCELVGREKGSQLNSQWGALTRGAWKGERTMSGRAGAPQTLAFPRVSSADSINLGGDYECDRAPQAHPEASMWVQAVYLGDDPGSTEREWSMRLEGRKPAS